MDKMTRGSCKNCFFTHTFEEKIDPGNYQLHNHYGMYEIFIFLKGEASFIVEGTTYPLKKYDTVILNPNEFHNIRHSSDVTYERFVLTLRNSFFVDGGCDRFRHMLDARAPGTQNMIPAEFIIKNKVPDILERLEEYAADKNSDILIPCAVTELLNALDKYHHTATLSADNEKITPIIMYINENLTSPLTIESIADTFYLNKYHLCRIFKKHTGMTVNKYITHKRILLVKNLCRDGKNLTRASLEAGFGSYSNFYKMYMKENSAPPSAGIKKSAASLVMNNDWPL